MFEKINNQKFTILPKTPKENEALCEHCGGTGWMIDKERGILENCGHCHNGIIRLCEYCGNPLNSYGQCKDEECKLNRDKKREWQRVKNELDRKNEARHYTIETAPKESTIMLYSDDYDYNNGYFNDMEWIDSCNEKPTYVWGTKAIPFELIAYNIVQNALEDSFEDAFDMVDDEVLKELQDAMDKFVKAHGDSLTTYYVDYNACIDL